jgi:Ca2+-transporting ATPase
MSVDEVLEGYNIKEIEQSDLCEAPAMMATVISSAKASSLSVEEVLKQFSAHESRGLTNDEIERRRMLHGWNEFDVSEEKALWKKYLDQVKF